MCDKEVKKPPMPHQTPNQTNKKPQQHIKQTWIWKWLKGLFLLLLSLLFFSKISKMLS